MGVWICTDPKNVNLVECSAAQNFENPAAVKLGESPRNKYNYGVYEYLVNHANEK